MTDLNSYGYNTETRGFCSQTEQINWHLDKFKKANEEALDRNTDAIKEQTAQQKADAEAGRTAFSDWMNNLVTRIKTIFSKDANDNETSYYEMMESEQKRMQAYVSAHTATVKTNADTTNARLQSIITELKSIQTNDDENANAIKGVIETLDLVVNNTVNVPMQ